MHKSGANVALAVGRSLRDFLTHTSSHGFKYLGEDDRPRSEKVFWVSAISLSLATTAFMVLNIYGRYCDSPTVMTLQDTHYPTWRIPFPAVALCNPNQVLASRATKLIESLELPAYMDKHEAVKVLNDLSALIDPEQANTGLVQKLQDLLKINRLQAHQLMAQVAQPCSDMLEICMWHGQVSDCDKFFKMEKSHLGYCCSFNYHLNGSDFEALHSNVYGEAMGLSVLVKPEQDTGFTSNLLSDGLVVLVHDPFVYPDEHVVMKMVPLNTEALVPVLSTIRSGSEDFAEHSQWSRKCVYSHEAQLSVFGRYFGENCLTECKINFTLRQCGCVPYFYPYNVDNIRICDLNDVNCIDQNFDAMHTFRPGSVSTDGEVPEHILHTTSAITCNCPAQCEATLRVARASYTQLASSSYSHSPIFQATGTNNVTDRVLVHVYMESDISSRIERGVKTSTSYLLGLLGGIASLFLGCSFVTPIEFSYFVTVRLRTFLGTSPEQDGGSCPASPRANYPERYLRQVTQVRFPSVRTQNKVAEDRLSPLQLPPF